ncbi:NACHT domain-containing protein [Paenibacillus wulumuqiensis]|uniref:NACHT domain-containing protein n=1 Tax=Paenibacillus wulumuqiensis TaxID=1567107 RepID=UPI00061977E8|nr:ATP-binding protein [Paenibacillus wulumuqiensis]
MSIDWHNINIFNGSKNNAFEELVCQLARAEEIKDKKDFYRIAAPDGGVEAYCTLKNGEEYGWQAKYFFSMGRSQWNQITDSLNTALEKHPNLKKYIVCIPLDRQDPRIENQNWFMDRWNTKVEEWKKYAKKLGRTIEIDYWGSSELIYRLSKEIHAGRKLFWFSTEEFSDNWFKEHVNSHISDLGKRYSPEINVELDIATNFNFLSRDKVCDEKLKIYFHSLLVSINKILTHELIQMIPDRINLVSENKQILLQLYTQFQAHENRFLDLNQAKKTIYNLFELLENIDFEEEVITKAHNKNLQNEIYKLRQDLRDSADFLNDPAIDLINEPLLFLTGEAGVGKSHLLADIAQIKIKDNKGCIFLLGQHFTSENPPWKQIIGNLLRVRCTNEKELLGALEAKAEAQGERILFIIDAINEGKGRLFWPEHIKGFIHLFQHYPNISLVMSVRSSYEKLLIKEVLENNKGTRIQHSGFDNIEYQATSLFFEQYGIEQPSVPLLHPEFSNPLFLKLFCEGLERNNLHKIPKGYSGISSIIDFFIRSVDRKLSKPSQFNYPEDIHVIKRVINELIKYKFEKDLNYIPYEVAYEIAETIIAKFTNERRFLDALISEGVFSENLFWEKNVNEKGIYLAYERFEDHFLTAYLLDEHLDLNNPKSSFQEGTTLNHYLQNSLIYQNMLESLSIQLPERANIELYELLEEEEKSDWSVRNSFVNSLIWRKTDSIKYDKKNREYINNYVMKYVNGEKAFFEMMYSVCMDPDHPYNADRLHQWLMQYSLADRDSIWTAYLGEIYDTSAPQRLVDWAIYSKGKEHLSKESKLLGSIAMAWLCTSTNISLRNAATYGMVSILEENINLILELLVKFETVNDPYVYERILAAGYGAILNSNKLNGLNEVADYIIKFFFGADEVYPNVLVRDYARNIVEYAQYKKVINLVDMDIVRPPYKSYFPTVFPKNKTIDAYYLDYKAGDFKDYYWSQNIILSSMITEYGRGISSYGDFGRYIFQSALHSWKHFDPNDLSNYACKLIFEDYGYDVDKHGEFDRNSIRTSEYDHLVERIGKKYQWIALYEVMARLSDNYKMVDESSLWEKDEKYMWFQGPWNEGLRSFDPTVRPRKPLRKKNMPKNTKYKYYNSWEGSNKEWLSQKNDLPEILSLLSYQRHKEDWVLLEGHFKWQEPVPLGREKDSYQYKQLWYQIRSYLVKIEDQETILKWLADKHLMGRWFPEASHIYGVFKKEFYWSPAYNWFQNPYYGGESWKVVHDQNDNSIVRVLPTVEYYDWESDEGWSLMPKEHLYEGIGAQYSNEIGGWENKDKKIICQSFLGMMDSQLNLGINKEVLQKFLGANKLAIFWTCLGEKNITGSFDRGGERTNWLEISSIYSLEDNGQVTLRSSNFNVK